ncbi:MAG TPA: hypothetical protein P5309_03810 [Syntrophomonadaceae bacterium]|nr:hypothetical protein [Syntrophomonadaceae bacterium]
MILNMLRYRLYMPVEVIVDRLFGGNRVRANEQVIGLENSKLIEFAGENQISLTAAGKMFLSQQRRQNK